MKINSYKNKYGFVKLIYRKRFIFFGAQKYYVIGHNSFKKSKISHKTFVFYDDIYNAKRTFETLKAVLVLEEKK